MLRDLWTYVLGVTKTELSFTERWEIALMYFEIDKFLLQYTAW